ncbi:MAG: hypothetical protein IRZ32_17035 [Solirubrobacteraceae bacterium]|nr:hypothetical protein [Solirubrobacteraceae bacterium]
MELTLDQAREIARLRRRHPGARLVVHERDADVIVEVRRRGHTIAVRRFAGDGSTQAEEPLALAVAA